MLTPQEWIDNGTVVFEDNIITNAGEGKAPIEGAFRTIVLKAGIPLEDAIKMSSLTPARIMHVDDRKGLMQRYHKMSKRDCKHLPPSTINDKMAKLKRNSCIVQNLYLLLQTNNTNI